MLRADIIHCAWYRTEFPNGVTDRRMRWLTFIPGKATLLLLFNAAKRRLSEQTDDVAELPNARIISATEELNQIADDIRDAQDAPEESPLAIPPDTGKHSAPGEFRQIRSK